MARNGYRNGNGERNGERRERNGNGGDRMPTIGDREDETSYPQEDCGDIGRMNPSGLGPQNMNVANFPEDPPVFNESPSTKKSYAWNRGEEGNANG
jgi:hypothetical protein